MTLTRTSCQDSPPVALKSGWPNLAFSEAGRLSKCSPSWSPKFNSLNNFYYSTLKVGNANAKNEVSIDLIKSELWYESTFKSINASESLNAYFRPKSERGTSIHPVKVPDKFPYDSQFRIKITFFRCEWLQNFVRL